MVKIQNQNTTTTIKKKNKQKPLIFLETLRPLCEYLCLSNSFSLQTVSSSLGRNQYKFCGCLAGPKGQFDTGVQCSKETRNHFVQLHKMHYWHSLAFSITRSKDCNLNICIKDRINCKNGHILNSISKKRSSFLSWWSPSWMFLPRPSWLHFFLMQQFAKMTKLWLW